MYQNCPLSLLIIDTLKAELKTRFSWMEWITRRIYRGAVNLIRFRHYPFKNFWKYTIWKIYIQYKNDWYTLQKLTKPVFAFRHWENLVSSSIYPSWKETHCYVNWKSSLPLHRSLVLLVTNLSTSKKQKS